ncbi:MAG TPA: hypothetical protein PLU54_13810, partial [Deltaproteobacteria bacterium]|nr:hypothetical protein [Deltaproteobacteria bacterium]
MDIRRFRSFKEGVYKYSFAMLAFASLVFLLGIILTLFMQSWQVFSTIPLTDMVFGKHWYPTHEDAAFGMWPLMAG